MGEVSAQLVEPPALILEPSALLILWKVRVWGLGLNLGFGEAGVNIQDVDIEKDPRYSSITRKEMAGTCDVGVVLHTCCHEKSRGRR